MEDYKKMYDQLFNRVTDIIEQLKAAQNESEDIFIYSGEKNDNMANEKPLQ